MKKLLSYLLALFLIVLACSDDNNEPQITLKYNLTTAVTPDGGGTITPASGSFNEGHKVSLTAKPNTGFTFKSWSGSATGSELTTSISMSGHKKVTAVFEKEVVVHTNGEGVIGRFGGTVKIEDSDSPLNGVTIFIPEGALSTDENIKISLAPSEVTFPYELSSPIIRLEPDGLEFNKEIEIEIPYKNGQDTTHLSLINYDQKLESIVELEKVRVKTSTKKIKALTNHFSDYAVWDKKVIAYGTMYKVDNGTIAASVNIVGRNSVGFGLENIKTLYNHRNDNAFNCLLDDGEDPLFSVFHVSLVERNPYGLDNPVASHRLVVRRLFNQGVSGIVYDSNGNEYYRKHGLERQDIGNTKNSVGDWFSGAPLIFHFDYEPKSNIEYYLGITWILSGNTGYTEGHTHQYFLKTKDQRAKLSEMTDLNDDSNKNLINDDYEPKAPDLKINSVESLSKTSVKVTSTIYDDGGATIKERGVYYSLNMNPDGTRTDDKVEKSTTGGDGTFEITITGLKTNANYYFVAYAENDAGIRSISNQGYILTDNLVPKVLISEPDAEKSYQKGLSVSIKAKAKDDDGTIENVKIYIDDILKKEFTSSQSEYSYTWDTSNASIEEHEIKVTATDDRGIIGYATRKAEVRDGNLIITQPNSQTLWQDGDQNKEIKWETGGLGGNVILQWYRDSKKVGTLTGSENTPNDGSFIFNIKDWSGGDNYQIRIVSVEYPDKEDLSEKFKVKEAVNYAPTPSENTYPKDGAEIDSDKTTLNWEFSDPEKDELTYDVYFGTSNNPPKVTTAKQNEDTFDVVGLVSGTIYNWYIIAYDDKGNSTKSDTWRFTVGFDEKIYTKIPDSNLEQALVDQRVDDKVDGYSLTKKLKEVEYLYLKRKGISDLTGIEAMVNLRYLEVNENNLTSLNLQNNLRLTELYCQSNEITELNLNNLKSLMYFSASNNPISKIDLKNNTSLIGLDISGTRLNNIDLSNNKLLESLYINDNDLKSLDLSTSIKLKKMRCDENDNLNCIKVSESQLEYIPRDWIKGSSTIYSTTCEGDADFDGVSNNIDLCPDTPRGELVDKFGCSNSQFENDDDGDGIQDRMDKCNNTPEGETVNSEGCSNSQLDDDNDGVINGKDNCNNTPEGETVNSEGCSNSQLDDDNDGVFNNLDLCPDSTTSSVDSNGCADDQIDDDKDGISNQYDRCKETPIGTIVGSNGCKLEIPVVMNIVPEIIGNSVTLIGYHFSDRWQDMKEWGFYISTSANSEITGTKYKTANRDNRTWRQTLSYFQRNVTYYYRAYAINDAGEGFSLEGTFMLGRNDSSIIPTTFNGRNNNSLGTVNLSSKNITISVWDHGQIDGDILSIYVNGKTLIAEKTLDGPSNKFVVKTTLEYSGYNYILLYAHNEGSVPPNTCAISIDDGVSTKEFTMEANLETNGAVDLIVD